MKFSILAAVFVIGGIILFHEFGHFLVARLSGVGVVEFSVGMGPRLLSYVSRKTNTRYSLKLLPIGGACAMVGEPGEDGGDFPVSGDSFLQKPPLVRMAIVAAGPFFNFLLAFFLAVVILLWAGYDSTVLLGVTEGLSAEAAGMQAGDVIKKVGSRKTHISRDIMMYTMLCDGSPVPVVYERYDENTGQWNRREAVLQPSLISGKYYFGFQIDGFRKPVQSVGQAISYGLYEVQFWIRAILDSFRMLAGGRAKRDDIAGPVRIAAIIDDTVESSRSYGFLTVLMNLFNLMVMFSSNLGILNLFPLPVLDGGRILLLAWELITRRPLNQKLENALIMAGMAVLMTLMVFVLLNDIRSLLA